MHIDIKFVREKLRSRSRGATIPEIAAELKIAQRTIYNVLQGKRDPKYSTVEKLYEFFNR